MIFRRSLEAFHHMGIRLSLSQLINQRRIEMEFVQEKNLLGHKSGIYSLEVLPNNLFLSGAGDGWIVEWPILADAGEDGALISKVDAQIFDLCFHEPSQAIWVGDMNGGIYAVDYAKKSLLNKQAHHNKGTYAVHPGEDFVLTAGADGRFTLWSPESFMPEESFTISKKHLRALAFHPHRPVMAIAGGDGHIYLFHTESWKCIQKIEEAHERSIFDMVFHPEGNLLYSGGMDAHLKAWQWESGKLHQEVPAHIFTINALAVDASRNIILSASRDNSLKVWNLSDLSLLKVIDSTKKSYHMNSVNALRYCARTDCFISASDDRTIRTWSVKDHH